MKPALYPRDVNYDDNEGYGREEEGKRQGHPRFVPPEHVRGDNHHYGRERMAPNDDHHRSSSYGGSQEGDMSRRDYSYRRHSYSDESYDRRRSNDHSYRRGNDNFNDNRSNDRHHHSKEDSYYGPSNARNSQKYNKDMMTVVPPPKDENLPQDLQKDPRGEDPRQRMTKKATSRGNGRNTESFDPASTLVRPDVRVLVGSPHLDQFNKQLRHDDVVIVPELFGKEDDFAIYYTLLKELTELQKDNVKDSSFTSWHEGAHLICKEPKESKTYQMIVDKLCQYFNIDASSAGTRFNFYKDTLDWKPFHHDSAAFNPRRAKSQNITVGVSFGATRELAFIRAPQQQQQPPQPQQGAQPSVRMYFPQTNNGVFTFGRDVNINWKHGVNALPPSEQTPEQGPPGRISIILWGLARNVMEEEGSPPLLGSDGQGPHAQHRKHGHGHNRHHHNHHHHNHHKKRRYSHHDNHHQDGGRDKENGNRDRDNRR